MQRMVIFGLGFAASRIAQLMERAGWEVVSTGRNGTLREMWGTGTAAVVSPIGTLGYKGEDVTINAGATGEVTQRLYDAIVGLQYGRSNDPHNWTTLVPGTD